MAVIGMLAIVLSGELVDSSNQGVALPGWIGPALGIIAVGLAGWVMAGKAVTGYSFR